MSKQQNDDQLQELINKADSRRQNNFDTKVEMYNIKKTLNDIEKAKVKAGATDAHKVLEDIERERKALADREDKAKRQIDLVSSLADGLQDDRNKKMAD